jgi:hypothetical protein
MRRGHVLVEALAGGAVIALVLAGLASSEINARRLLDRSIDDVEMARAASERLEFLRAEPSTSASWTVASNGAVTGHPGWSWKIEPAAFTDSAVSGVVTSLPIRRARVTITGVDGRTLTVEELRW